MKGRMKMLRMKVIILMEVMIVIFLMESMVE